MASGSLFRRPAVFLALALCSVGGVVTILGRLASGPAVPQKRFTFSRETGMKAYPAFSPDGQRIAYSYRDSATGPFHIFIRAVGEDIPRQLTSGPGSDFSPVWSPEGTKIAFARVEGGQLAYRIAGVDGDAEQEVVRSQAPAEDGYPLPSVAWAPDGQSLIIVQTALQRPSFLARAWLRGGELRRITNPPEGGEGDSTPSVSPDGTTLAFVRSSSSEGADIFLCDLAGNAVRRLTFDDRPIRGISWTRDSQDLVYAVNRFGSGSRLLRIPAYGGTPREISIAGHQAETPAVALAGNRLAYIDRETVSAIWRARLSSSETTVREQALIRSNGRESFPAYSPDGQKIADVSTESGNEEIWISDDEGRNRRMLTRLHGPSIRSVHWSPDSQAILFTLMDHPAGNLYSVSVTQGTSPKLLVTGASAGVLSPDGKFLYYQVRGQLWKAGADGKNPQPLANVMGAGPPAVSMDGGTIYFWYRRSVWKVPAAGGEPQEVFAPERDLLRNSLQIVSHGLYGLEFERASRSIAVSYYDLVQRQASVVFHFRDTAQFSVSPDGQYLLYPKIDRDATNLVLVENFR
jgi:Tol biopolymer transport system component